MEQETTENIEISESQNDQETSEKETSIQLLTYSIDELKLNFEKTQEEIKEVKETLKSVVPIVKDFTGLLQDKPLFERSRFLYLHPLAVNIKNEIIRQIMSRLIEPNENIKSLQEELSNYKEETSKQVYNIHQEIEQAKELQQKSTEANQETQTQVDSAFRMIEDIKDDMMTKATQKELNKVIDKLNFKTPIEVFNDLEERFKECPTRDQIDRINQQIQELNEKMVIYATKETLKDQDYKVRDDFKKQLESYLLVEDFHTDLDSLVKKDEELHSALSNLNSRVENMKAEFKKNINELFKTFQKKPWMDDIYKVMDQVKSKLSKKDFENYKEEIEPRIEHFDKRILEFKSRIENFALVIERYDEILLDKASKDDYKKIQDELGTFLKIDKFDANIASVEKKISNLEELTETQANSIQNNDKQFSKFFKAYNTFKKNLSDFYTMYNSLSDIKESIEGKAEKAEIYAIIDSTSKREEVNNIKESLDRLHKQLETHVLLSSASMRSFIQSFEMQSNIKRQQKELYKNLASLLHWVSGSVPPEIDASMHSARLVLSPAAKLTEDWKSDSLDIPLPLLKATHNRNKTLAKTPQHDRNQSFDLPPL